jgi:catalase
MKKKVDRRKDGKQPKDPQRASPSGDGRHQTPPPSSPGNGLLRRQDKDQALEVFRQRFRPSELTTDQGIPIPQTDDSLKAGLRGPSLLEDFHLREKITRFDHERIPERVVHARGSGAHGFFQVYESLRDLTSADFLQDPAMKTPVFVRFSTVVGSRGSTDLARDVRGFATRFYTRQGNFDLVGNNMPVFFIQDGIKFPDLVHAVKPEPHHEMPQAASAHDTFWDFVSLVPETMHMVMWLMSDRALPRSYRMMQGFGVHTFRLVNEARRTVLVKFHWIPVLGTHSLLWDEAQKISGKDPDFHRRDLWDAIESGNYPEYELGLQIMPEESQLELGFDLLDPTKLVPEELVPVRRVGKLTLDRNPDNFFAETEQVAYCVANIVPGVDFTNDPLMQARLFSYLDTQLLRLGGPNFAELPINRPLAPVRNHQQDGFGRRTIHTSRALYHPNSIEQNHPLPAPEERGFVHHEEPLERGTKVRARSPSFLDHFSQARLFLHSQSGPERAHLVEACRFELGKVERLAIRERVVSLFAEVDAEFAQEVALGIGVGRIRPARRPEVAVPTGTPAPSGRGRSKLDVSPALSLTNFASSSIRTRKIAFLAADGVRKADVDAVQNLLLAGGAVVEIVAPFLGPLKTHEGIPLAALRSFLTVSSVLYDAVFVPGGEASVDALLELPAAAEFVREAFLHAKPIAALNEGVDLLADLQLDGLGLETTPEHHRPIEWHGVVTGWATQAQELESFAESFVSAIAEHRHFERPGQPSPARPRSRS